MVSIKIARHSRPDGVGSSGLLMWENDMRKLASIRRVAEIKPIDGADAIEAIRVDGWWCVSKKGEFQVDDLCVYFEIDSFLPVRPEFEFLRKFVHSSWKDQDNSIWFAHRPSKPDETFEEIVYQQSSPLGVMQGKVVFRERKCF